MRYSRGKLVQIAKVVIGWSLLVVVVLAFSVLLLIKVIAPNHFASKHDQSLGDVIADSRCYCVCPHNLNVTLRHNTTVFQSQVGDASDCTCESTVPESDETLCLRCECRYESRNVALVAIIVYGSLAVIFGGVPPCVLVVCLQPALRRRTLLASNGGYSPLQDFAGVHHVTLTRRRRQTEERT